MCSKEDLDKLYQSQMETNHALNQITTQMSMIRADFYGIDGKKGVIQKIQAHEKFIWMFGGVISTMSVLGATIVIMGQVLQNLN